MRKPKERKGNFFKNDKKPNKKEGISLKTMESQGKFKEFL